MFEIVTTHSMKGNRMGSRKIVTMRCSPNKNKNTLSVAVSIGLEVAEALNFKEGQRIHLSRVDNYPSILKVWASENNLVGYKLSPKKHANFVRFVFISKNASHIKLKETFSCEFDVNESNNSKVLFIDTSKLDKTKTQPFEAFKQPVTQRIIHTFNTAS